MIYRGVGIPKRNPLYFEYISLGTFPPGCGSMMRAKPWIMELVAKVARNDGNRTKDTIIPLNSPMSMLATSANNQACQIGIPRDSGSVMARALTTAIVTPSDRSTPPTRIIIICPMETRTSGAATLATVLMFQGEKKDTPCTRIFRTIALTSRM